MPASFSKPIWPDSQPTRGVNDIVYYSIALPHPLDVIVDTAEFQRLRNVRQLGAATYVFPSANHTRFVHCIGTCHVAQLVISKLRQYPDLDVTDEDAICVAIAALCHDIGHGPYSHLYDGPFMEELGKGGQWTHEEGSKSILRRVFEYPRVEQALREHLGGADDKRYKRNLDFIIELISPPEKLLGLDGAWTPTGRGVEKSFLYDIVSNVHDGFDVDKFDYILRDSLLSGFGIQFVKSSLLRIVDNLRVLKCPRLGLNRICFASKTAEELLSLATSRHVLHARVYQHKTVGLIEAMIVKAFIAADPHVEFRNKKGEKFKLSEMYRDHEVFCGVDDSILQIIAASDNPNLKKAQGYLKAIAERNLAKRVAYVECSPEQNEKLSNIVKERYTVARSVHAKVTELGKAYGIIGDDVYVVTRRIFSGLDGYRHPMSEVLVYDPKDSEPVARRLDAPWLDLRASRHKTMISFALHLPKSLKEETIDLLRSEFNAALSEYGIEVNRSNEGPSPKKMKVVENNN